MPWERMPAVARSPVFVIVIPLNGRAVAVKMALASKPATAKFPLLVKLIGAKKPSVAIDTQEPTNTQFRLLVKLTGKVETITV